MKIKYKFLFVTLFLGTVSLSQETTSEEQLDEILITSSRIDLPFSENSRTITVITSEDIKNSTATNVTDLLQSVAGLDIRRRGIDGMQSDIYIRERLQWTLNILKEYAHALKLVRDSGVTKTDKFNNGM